MSVVSECRVVKVHVLYRIQRNYTCPVPKEATQAGTQAIHFEGHCKSSQIKAIIPSRWM
jgi:hypothetical protein